MSAETSWLPFLLQTSDALFPTGAYAHSLGFEEIVRLRLVNNEATLTSYLEEQITPALTYQELPYLRFAYDAAQAGNLTLLVEIDHEISAWKAAQETRDASTQIGIRRLRALRVISESATLARYDALIHEGAAVGHHLVVYALQSASEQVPLAAASQAYFYQALASICSAALKLIRIGQDGCQRALRSACTGGPQAIAASLEVQRADAGWFNPVLEIASMRHARAEERLFIS